MSIAPVLVFVTENSASVDSGVLARWAAMSPFISQYGTKPKTSWPGTGWLVGAAEAEADAAGVAPTMPAARTTGRHVVGRAGHAEGDPQRDRDGDQDGTDADDGPSGHGRSVRPQTDRVNCGRKAERRRAGDLD